MILRIFTYSLKLPEDFFDKRLHEQAHTLRFLHYPPLDAASVETASEQSSYTHHDTHTQHTHTHHTHTHDRPPSCC